MSPDRGSFAIRARPSGSHDLSEDETTFASSFLLLVAMPGAPRRVLAPVVRPGAPSSLLFANCFSGILP